jgi:hypothetical protein
VRIERALDDARMALPPMDVSSVNGLAPSSFASAAREPATAAQGN